MADGGTALDLAALAAAPPIRLAEACPAREGGAEGARGALLRGEAGTFAIAPAERLSATGGLKAAPAGLAAVPRLGALLDPAPVAPPAMIHVLADALVHTGSWTVFLGGRPLLESIPPWHRGRVAEFLAEPRFAQGWAEGIATRVDGPVLCMQTPGGRNYWHWHADCLAALALGREALGREVPILLHVGLPAFQDGALRLTPWTGPVLRSGGLVRCAALAWPSPLAVSVTPGAHAGRAFAAIRAGVAAAPAGPRVYVARFDAPGRRAIENEEALAEALAAEGFEVVTPGALPYAAQVARFAAARLILGAHGAGLTNAGFAAPGAALVELHPAGYGVPTHARLAMLRGLAWHGWLMDPVAGQGHEARCRVDIPALLAQLRTWDLLGG
ncbi:glycosyltransferase family 61 protein [Roseomonas sp. PWR1]|uniref:Glycosyltransferase family 61 protein n=1 Tax=Roseomonas nitratireducens TaxID=2820810 RepID=A0ABS4ANK4_9PROT|nr:glycosyltransferase 61 family protein [Neoroseomonas nitratireducens]MBP0462946.1 glycosyltransferase family 61 protein [Neoroseomonas nitratireducens]